jgi:hypothetical protein
VSAVAIGTGISRLSRATPLAMRRQRWAADLHHPPTAGLRRVLSGRGWKSSKKLLPMFYLLNPFLTTKPSRSEQTDPAMMIGYCPRCLACEVRELASLAKETFDLEVARINNDAPIQFRLLCRLMATLAGWLQSSAWRRRFNLLAQNQVG